MKTINKALIIALFLFVSSLTMGQTTKDVSTESKHELSIVIDDIFAPEVMPMYPVYFDPYVVYYSSYPMMDKNSTKIGLGYKFHFEENALRAKVSFGIGNDTYNDKEDDFKVESKNLMTRIFIGYERNMTLGKAQIFYGFDFGFNRYSSSIKSEDTDFYFDYESESKTTYTGYGISPLIGVRYYITPKFSVSTEIKYKVESYTGEGTYKYNDNEEEKETENGIYTEFGPMGQLSINIHF